MSSSTNTKPTCIGILSTVASRRRTLSTVARDHAGNRTTANSLNQTTITVVQTRSSQCTIAKITAKIVILMSAITKIRSFPYLHTLVDLSESSHAYKHCTSSLFSRQEMKLRPLRNQQTEFDFLALIVFVTLSS